MEGSRMAERKEPESPPSPTDPDALAKVLEMELMFKRAAWQKARARRGTWRILSILFLLLVLLGALFAYFYLMPRLAHPERKPDRAENSDLTR